MIFVNTLTSELVWLRAESVQKPWLEQPAAKASIRSCETSGRLGWQLLAPEVKKKRRQNPRIEQTDALVFFAIVLELLDAPYVIVKTSNLYGA